MKPRLAATAVVIALTAACSGGSDDEPAAKDPDLITPQFGREADTAASGGSTSTAAASSETSPSSQTPGAFVETSADIVDPSGDATASAVDQPPAWAELRGGRLLRTAQGFQLRIRMAGAVPHTGDADHTTNVASFYDVDGDGTIDYEVWANLAKGGWGTSWFDNRNERAFVGKDDRVNVEVVGDEVVLRFPLGHIGDAERFRWSLASEWGRLDALGTLGSVRDDAPDDDQAASFPS